MPLTAHDLLKAADRRWLAQELLHPPGDGSTEAEIEAAWSDEIKRRLDEIDSGAVEMIPLEKVLDDMNELIACQARPGIHWPRKLTEKSDPETPQ